MDKKENTLDNRFDYNIFLKISITILLNNCIGIYVLILVGRGMWGKVDTYQVIISVYGVQFNNLLISFN